MKNIVPIALLLLSIFYFACDPPKGKPLDMSNVIAWCIVPFDSLHRTPEQRIDMLKELGIQRYAYDWREQHLTEMVREWNLAKQNNIKIDGVWMWYDAKSDSLGKLSTGNEHMLANLDSAGLKTTVWLSFNQNNFSGLSDSMAIHKAAGIVSELADRLSQIGCKLALYNHEDWFGEPANEIAIIKALPGKNIGMVYNFHHAHNQVDRFDQFVDSMLPYLTAVNINGLRKDGPMILPINTGDKEQAMVKTLINKGYKGPWGVLGHIEQADVKKVLEKNLEGLRQLLL
jgi:hypothetical protein